MSRSATPWLVRCGNKGSRHPFAPYWNAVDGQAIERTYLAYHSFSPSVDFVAVQTNAQMVAFIPRLRRYARALVGERAAADDLVQDTLERALAKFHLWRRGSDLRAWLFTIMHNVHVNQVRGRREVTPLDEEALEQPVRATQDVALEARDLERSLALLSVEQREVLLLVTLEEMTYEEAASTLGIPIGTVMSRLSRAREKLRGLMEGLPPSNRLHVVK